MKMALYDQPTDTGRLSKPRDADQNNDVSLELANRLPGYRRWRDYAGYR